MTTDRDQIDPSCSTGKELKLKRARIPLATAVGVVRPGVAFAASETAAITSVDAARLTVPLHDGKVCRFPSSTPTCPSSELQRK